MSNRLFNPQYLKAHYRLNGVTDDYTGQNSSATWTGTEKYSTNTFGKASAEFIGDANNIITLNKKFLSSDDGLAPFTVFGFFSAQPTPNQALFSQYIDSNDPTRLVIFINGGKLTYFKGGVFLIQDTNTLTPGNHSFGATKSPTGVASLYLDGKLVGSASETDVQSDTENVIGANSIGGTLALIGLMYDLLIYNTNLSSDEIKELHKRLQVSKNQVPVKFTESYNPDSSLVIQTLINDDNDLSANNVDTTSTNVSLGKGGIFTNGSLVFPSQTFISYAYSYRESNGALSRYLFDGTNTYKNGVSGATLPLTITSTGFTGFTGEIQNLQLWNVVKTPEQISIDYLHNRKYW